MDESTAKNIMAKHAQSNSQFEQPHSMMRMTSRGPRRTAVTRPTILFICSATSPRGRPTTLCEMRRPHVTTMASGRS